MTTLRVSRQAGISRKRFVFDGDGTPADWSLEDLAWGFPSETGAIPEWTRKMVSEGHEVELVVGQVFQPKDRRFGAPQRVGYAPGFDSADEQSRANIEEARKALTLRVNQFGMTEGTHYTLVTLLVGPEGPATCAMKLRYTRDHTAV